jgi:hypothetical protein
MRRTTLMTMTALVAAGLASGAARADGLPFVGVDAGPDGVSEPTGDTRYVTLPAGEGTVVARVEQDGGRIVASRFLPGGFTVPLVAFDGSAGGLSADGRTLVVIRPRLQFPRARTSFAVLGTRRLRVRDEVTLRGDFSFDALSPDGRWLYLIEYVAPKDPNQYAVRLYDLAAGRLLPEPIVDPDEAAEPMRGYPITRATSPDGRLAYTLYDGAGEHPFIHALDTVGRTAVCIDLHGLMGRADLYDLRLAVSEDGSTLEVRGFRDAVAVVDTRTYEVGEPTDAPALQLPVAAPPPTVPAKPAAVAPERQPEADPGDGIPWAVVGAASGALLALVAIGVATLRRRASSATVGTAGGLRG